MIELDIEDHVGGKLFIMQIFVYISVSSESNEAFKICTSIPDGDNCVTDECLM